MECIKMRRITTVIPLHYKIRLIKLSGMQEKTVSCLIKDMIYDYLRTNLRISKSGKRKFFVNTDDMEPSDSHDPTLRITAIVPLNIKKDLEKLCLKEGRTVSNMMRKIINKMIMNNGIDYKPSVSVKVNRNKNEMDLKIDEDYKDHDKISSMLNR